MLRGLASAMHAIKLECQSETDSMGRSAALLDHFHHRWRVTGKPKGKSANMKFEWLSEVPLWWLQWDLGMLWLSMMVLTEVKPWLLTLLILSFPFLLVLHLASARHCYLETRARLCKFTLRPNSPVLTTPKRRFSFSLYPWKGTGFFPHIQLPCTKSCLSTQSRVGAPEVSLRDNAQHPMAFKAHPALQGLVVPENQEKGIRDSL